MLFAFTAKNNLLLSPFDKIKKPSPWGKVDAKRTDEGCVKNTLKNYFLFNNFSSVIRMLLTVCLGGLAYLMFLLLLDRRIVEEIFAKRKENSVKANGNAQKIEVKIQM